VRWWKPWQVVIVGLLSGRRTPLPWVRFWREFSAREWADTANAQLDDDTVVRYEVERR
jgi:hypothetical protein